jgi:hypothetical protein
MMRFLDKLNLRPGERRLVVLVAFTVFIVLNLIFVWPHFGDLALASVKLDKARLDLVKYERKVQQTDLYKTRLQEYEKDNPEVPTEDQGAQFQRAIQQQAAASGVNVTTFSRATTKTNSIFFLEQLQTISVQTTETNLVDFLYNLGAGQSLIRVRELALRPDQPRFNLGGNITLVASYQKKVPVKGAASTAPAVKPAAETVAPSPKPAAATPKPAVPAVSKPLTNRAPATAVRPPGGTNAAAASPSAWSKVKGWFGGSSTNAPAATVKPKPAAPKTPGTPPNGPKFPVPPNRPPPGSPPTGQPPQP